MFDNRWVRPLYYKYKETEPYIHPSYYLHVCPCGFFGDSAHACSCTANEIKRYTKKISGPLLDRIDIHIQVPRVEYKELTETKPAEASTVIRSRVEAARCVQLNRFKKNKIFCNAQMSHAMLKRHCVLTPEAEVLLELVFKKMSLSARSYDRIIKVARTIADLDQSEQITDHHAAEAIQLRNNLIQV